MENNETSDDEYLQNLTSQLNLENIRKEEREKAERFTYQFIAEVDNKFIKRPSGPSK